MKRLHRSLLVVLQVVLFFLFTVYFLFPVDDVDSPWHLKTGQYIVENNRIPLKDPFLYTTETLTSDLEKIVMSQYWFSQVLYWIFYKETGFAGLALFNALLLAGICIILWQSFRRKGILAASMVVLLFAPFLRDFSGVRPQVFSFFFTLLLLVILEGCIEDEKKMKRIWFVPLIMIMWANMHGGFLFGNLILVMFAVPEVFNVLRRGAEPSRRKTSLVFCSVCLVSLAASYLNPNGFDALPIALNPENISYGSRKVADYHSLMELFYLNPDVPGAAFLFWIFLGYVLIIMAISLTRKQFRSRDLLLVSGTLFMAVGAVRYMPLFLLTALPLSAKHDFPLHFQPAVKRLAAVIGIVVTVISFSYVAYGAAVKGIPDDFSFYRAGYAPENAVRFIQDNDISGKIFNSSYHGAYLIYRLYPQKIFNDPRGFYPQIVREELAVEEALRHPDDRESFLRAIIANTLAVYPELRDQAGNLIPVEGSQSGITEYWEGILGKYEIDIIIYKACDPYSGRIHPLILRLTQNASWELIYGDGDSLVFVRNAGKYDDLIRKYRKDKKYVFDEILLENRQVKYMSLSSMAFALMMTGRPQGGLELARKALEINHEDGLATLVAAFSLTILDSKSTKSSMPPGGTSRR